MTRIAPSPTGDPHVGTAYIGLFNRTLARQAGGSSSCGSRTTDRGRYVADSETRIFQMMQWLGRWRPARLLSRGRVCFSSCLS
ncbi:hypothetical protein CTI14_54350 [Methylobacterium radiotolerans]|nr:hypothetical protein CTI14_54350 [Methylobacterium radiotolerans]